jgi:hypothetical protein
VAARAYEAADCSASCVARSRHGLLLFPGINRK